MSDKSRIVTEICQALLEKGQDVASKIAREKYPFTLNLTTKRTYTKYQSVQIFIRDGFIDRYSEQKLVFPGVIRLLSMLLPQEFPFHKNWKMTKCHIIYWELFPTIDHIIPIARGGEDTEENWVCISMLRNSVKAHWLLEELGWKLVPPGKFHEWDGLLHWFLDYVDDHKNYLQNGYIKQWHHAAVHALNTINR